MVKLKSAKKKGPSQREVKPCKGTSILIEPLCRKKRKKVAMRKCNCDIKLG